MLDDCGAAEKMVKTCISLKKKKKKVQIYISILLIRHLSFLLALPC